MNAGLPYYSINAIKSKKKCDHVYRQQCPLKVYIMAAMPFKNIECCNAPTQLNATIVLHNIMLIFQSDVFSSQKLHLYPQDHHINVHKVVMAACSKFFKDQLCKVNVQVEKIS